MTSAEPAMLLPDVHRSLMEHGIVHSVLPRPDELSDTAAFCAHFGVPLGQAANTIELTGMRIGGVTPFGLPHLATGALAVYVDTAVLEQDHVIMGGGNRTSKLRLVPTELRKLPAVVLVEGLAVTREQAPAENREGSAQ